MRRFNFQLESILRIREHHERDWELKLAEITGKCMTLQNELAELRTQRRTSFAEHSEGPDLDSTDLQVKERYVYFLDTKIARLRTELEEREQERAEVQGKYLEASRRRKVLSKLKEKRADEFYKSQLKEEMKYLDEIGNGKIARLRAGNEEEE